MATTVTNKEFNRRQPMPTQGDVTLFAQNTASTIGAVINDAEKLFKLSRGIMLLHHPMIQAGDGDTGGPTLTLSLVVTNGTTTKTLIDASTAGQAGGVGRPSKAPATEDGLGFVTPDDSYWIELRAPAAATTPATFAWKVFVPISGHYPVGSITQ